MTTPLTEDRVPVVEPKAERYTHIGYIWGIEWLGIGNYPHPSKAHTRPCYLCADCGSVVFKTSQHDRWHEATATA